MIHDLTPLEKRQRLIHLKQVLGDGVETPEEETQLQESLKRFVLKLDELTDTIKRVERIHDGSLESKVLELINLVTSSESHEKMAQNLSDLILSLKTFMNQSTTNIGSSKLLRDQIGELGSSIQQLSEIKHVVSGTVKAELSDPEVWNQILNVLQDIRDKEPADSGNQMNMIDSETIMNRDDKNRVVEIIDTMGEYKCITTLNRDDMGRIKSITTKHV